MPPYLKCTGYQRVKNFLEFSTCAHMGRERVTKVGMVIELY